MFRDRSVAIDHATSPRALRLSRRAQLVIAVGAAALGAWTLGASGLVALQSWRDGQERAALAQADAAYQTRLAALQREVSDAHSAVTAADHRAEAAVAALQTRQDALAAAAARERALTAALARREQEIESLSEFKQEAARLSQIASERDELGAALSLLAAHLSDAANERDAARAQSAEFERAVAQLEQTSQRREKLLGELGHAAEMTIAPLEDMLRGVGVDVNSLVRELKSESAGGPFIPIDAAMRDEARAEGGVQVAAVISDLERVTLLRAAAGRMPFARPVPHLNISSRFGYRRDPLNRRAALHEGVDFRGARGESIHSTASGTVTFSGRQRGYGNVVKVRHDFGFETVYAHLNRRRVKVGDRVDSGDRIGDMGNTGRSTGVHLHYEIRVNGRPVDPMKFIEASRNVL